MEPIKINLTSDVQPKYQTATAWLNIYRPYKGNIKPEIWSYASKQEADLLASPNRLGGAAVPLEITYLTE